MNERTTQNPPGEPEQKGVRRKGGAGRRPLESAMQLIFFICGFIAIAFVLVILSSSATLISIFRFDPLTILANRD